MLVGERGEFGVGGELLQHVRQAVAHLRDDGKVRKRAVWLLFYHDHMQRRYYAYDPTAILPRPYCTVQYLLEQLNNLRGHAVVAKVGRREQLAKDDDHLGVGWRVR